MLSLGEFLLWRAVHRVCDEIGKYEEMPVIVKFGFLPKVRIRRCYTYDYLNRLDDDINID
jgi:hypothetical protein